MCSQHFWPKCFDNLKKDLSILQNNGADLRARVRRPRASLALAIVYWFRDRYFFNRAPGPFLAITQRGSWQCLALYVPWIFLERSHSLQASASLPGGHRLQHRRARLGRSSHDDRHLQRFVRADAAAAGELRHRPVHHHVGHRQRAHVLKRRGRQRIMRSRRATAST